MTMCRFAVIADTHYDIRPEAANSYLWNNQLICESSSLASALIESINALNLDFVLHAGDITHEGDAESLRFAAEVFRQFNCPCIVTPGDHDTAVAGMRGQMGNLFAAADGQFFRSLTSNGIRILVLDSAYGHTADGGESEQIDWHRRVPPARDGITAAQLQWVEQQLALDTDTPTFVTLHHPILEQPQYINAAFRSGAPLAQFPDEKRYPKYAAELVALFSRSSNVHAVFSGHWHIFDAIASEGTWYIHTGSLIEYPFSFRMVEVATNRAHFFVEQLAVSELSKRSIVPEWNASWVAGDASEREFEIPLSRKRFGS